MSHLSERQKEIDQVIDKVAKQFSIILLSLIHYFGISSIFIGGKGKYLGKSFLEKINETVKKYLFHKQETNIVFSDIDEPVISLGAAKYGLIKFLKGLIQ